MEFKTDALVLRAVDYGENDKMVTLLTADRGKLGVCFKGVKKAAARLKFAAQPFCFAEYVITERSGRHTVISASLHDGFYSLREDVTAFYAAAAVCEACDRLLYEGMENGALLLAALTALKELSTGSAAGGLIRFLLTALRLAGYPVQAGECPACGKTPAGRMRFDLESGAFFCDSCSRGAPASEITYRTVRAALYGGGNALSPQSPDGEKRSLRLLSAYFTRHTEAELSAVNELLSLL